MWLDANKIAYKPIDDEVIEIESFGAVFIANLNDVNSIFRGSKDNLVFNLMENPNTLIEEGIFYVVFPFGQNWYYYDLREKFKFNILKYIGSRKEPEVKVPFVNLGVHSPYELLNGSGDLSQWIKKAKLLGHDAIGICDRNTMAATLNLQKECTKAKIKHVFGYSFSMRKLAEEIDLKIYCQSNKGLRNLLRVQKEIMVDSLTGCISFPALKKYGKGNVLVFGKLSSKWMAANMELVAELEDAFDKVYYQVDLSEYKAERIDAQVLLSTKYFFDNFYIPEFKTFRIEPILICDNYYLDKNDARNKIILNKIASGAAHEQSDEQYFKDSDEHYQVFETLFDSGKWDVKSLFSLMCENTVDIARNANAEFELGRMFMPQYIMRDEEKQSYGDRHNMFISLITEGLNRIPDAYHKQYKERLKEEIYIIESTNNVDYFLIQWDMVREARKRGIAVGVGRGSAGGSLVSYLLGIISIDPIKYDLLFSRFLVPERCGLTWVDEITKIANSIPVSKGNEFVEVSVNGKRYQFDKDAKFLILRKGKRMVVYADELCCEDEIILDNRDLLWSIL